MKESKFYAESDDGQICTVADKVEEFSQIVADIFFSSTINSVLWKNSKTEQKVAVFIRPKKRS